MFTQNPVVGVDGGGTKTEAVIIYSNQQVIGEGLAGPSNPLRVGIAGAAAEILSPPRLDWPARDAESCVNACAKHSCRSVSAILKLLLTLPSRCMERLTVLPDWWLLQVPARFAVASTLAANAFAPVVGDRLRETKVAAHGSRAVRCEQSLMHPMVVVQRLSLPIWPARTFT